MYVCMQTIQFVCSVTIGWHFILNVSSRKMGEMPTLPRFHRLFVPKTTTSVLWNLVHAECLVDEERPVGAGQVRDEPCEHVHDADLQ